MALKSMVTAVSSALNRALFKHRYDATEAVDLARIHEFRGEAFPRTAPHCWLDAPDAEAAIARKLARGAITAEEAEACRFWVANGYFIAPGLLDPARLDAVWAAYEAALESGALGPRKFATGGHGERTLDPHLHVPAIAALQRDPRILRWTDLFFGRRTLPFQTIMGHAGSQQALHSDSIHMTTYPLGFLLANWIAFEDITPESGPLEYVPGSHRLPYLLSADVGITPYEFKEKGYGVYNERYEPAVREACAARGLETKTFLPRKGDVLFWHANLAHGGALRTDPALTRKALVCHYFAEGAVTYHDLSGNLTRLHRRGRYARPAL
jgi:hypothetical protein